MLKMNRRQRKRQLEQRRAHGPTVDRPRNVISRGHYSTVKRGHIVPACFQRNFAIDDMVAVHVPERGVCVRQHVDKAGTRSRFYRRERPNGAGIDDFEAMLGELESMTAPVLREMAAGAPLTFERKGVLTQFLGLQMLRGPAFVSEHNTNVERFIPETLTKADIKPALWAETGGDMKLARQRAVELFRHPTQRLMAMVTSSLKVSAVLGSMRWQLLSFEQGALAYSDQPVVVWPLGVDALPTLPDKPRFGPIEALEVQVPLNPRLMLLMTWADKPDRQEPVAAPLPYAAEANALVINQADKQWMHQLGEEPTVANGTIRPLSRAFEDGYTTKTARTSRRRATTIKYLRRVRNRRFLNDIEVVTLR